MVSKSLLFAGLVAFAACVPTPSKPQVIDLSDDSGLGRAGQFGGSGGGTPEASVALDGSVALDADDAAVVCNGQSLAGAPTVDRIAIADTTPTPMGGAIADG